MTGPRSYIQLVANLGLEARPSNSGAMEEPCSVGLPVPYRNGVVPCRLGAERKDRVKVGISFNPLIWLKPKPHWFEQETRDTWKGLLGAGQGGVEC